MATRPQDRRRSGGLIRMQAPPQLLSWPRNLRPFSHQHPDLLQLRALVSLDGVVHAFETRWGSLTDVLPSPVARVHQVHGAGVCLLPPALGAREPFLRPSARERPSGDALITDVPGITVAVAVADCLPILIADPRHRAVAAVHGGWRGLASGVVHATLEAMGRNFGSDPADCLVGIGPGIGPCCYEVGPEVIEAFAARKLDSEALVPTDGGAPDGRLRCHLPAVAVAVARRDGVPRSQIAEAELCTHCHGDRLWSYRRDGEAAGRMLAGIALLS
ncbi:MAG: peptidoglycan editing factor PgeF [Acidobacteriota bacterium]